MSSVTTTLPALNVHNAAALAVALKVVAVVVVACRAHPVPGATSSDDAGMSGAAAGPDGAGGRLPCIYGIA